MVLPNANSKHRCQRVSRLCDVSDVKTAGKPIPLQDENTAYWRCWDARKQSTRCNATQRVVVYLLDLSRASVFNVTPIMSLWDSRVSRQSGDRKVNAF